MSKNHKKELVTKGAVQEAIRITRRFPSDGGDADFVHIEELIKAIDRLPAEPTRKVLPASGQARPDEAIERAIEKFQQWVDSNFWHAEIAKEFADLLRWVLNQEQSSWTDRELLGKED